MPLAPAGLTDPVSLRMAAVQATDAEALADLRVAAMRVGALRGSRSNRFHERHGFVRVASAEWDHFYERPAAAAPA